MSVQSMFLITLRELFLLMRNVKEKDQENAIQKIFNLIERALHLHNQIEAKSWNKVQKFIHKQIIYGLYNIINVSKFVGFLLEDDPENKIQDELNKYQIPQLGLNQFGSSLLIYAELFNCTDIVNENNIDNPIPILNIDYQ